LERTILNSPWVPHAPTTKQAAFLAVPVREALFGGAAGGGKSDSLLMAALQYVDEPGYAAILFRRTYADLARLREVTASQGLMLESASERLMETVHAGPPTKHPARRLETIAAAGELKIPFTSGILVGIGESEEDRMAALETLADLHQRYGHIQEVILQNFVPHDSYYGREPAQIADQAAQDYWRTGVADGPQPLAVRQLARPPWEYPSARGG